ncbi:Heme efflux system ATPase HrtA [Staphylococcus aureus]|uniref:Heme efflux system ATPase HrtA n=1 Tax=Staphylococcus aureus TaxID=1280 RepID=A0A380ELJ3_STAAU|nr:Heme efflux system ATPase HrtA [Staphylococcus aureus]
MALVVEDIVKNFGEGLSETKVLKVLILKWNKGNLSF